MKKNNYFNGLKFGMLLQLTIGPMCLMVLNIAKNQGFFPAISLVLAITLVDAFYILLADLGVSRIIHKDNIKSILTLVGSIILIFLGASMALSTFNIDLLPKLNITISTSNLFATGIVLSLANPETIIFWGSVLTTKLLKEKLLKTEIMLFSIGIISSTLIFLTFVAALGTMLSAFIPIVLSNILNLIVGILIASLGVKTLLSSYVTKSTKLIKKD